MNVVGATSMNEDEIYQMEHEFCPNCIIAIVREYDRRRKSGEKLKNVPTPVEEKIYHILRVNMESSDGWNVCDHCGRLWKGDIRIVIPIGKCKRCIKTPNINTVFDFYKKV